MLRSRPRMKFFIFFTLCNRKCLANQFSNANISSILLMKPKMDCAFSSWTSFPFQVSQPLGAAPLTTPVPPSTKPSVTEATVPALQAPLRTEIYPGANPCHQGDNRKKKTRTMTLSSDCSQGLRVWQAILGSCLWYALLSPSSVPSTDLAVKLLLHISKMQ